MERMRKRGVGKDLAAQTAGSVHGPWPLANSPALALALPNAYFASLGIPPRLNNQIMDAVIRAVIEDSSGPRLQVGFGHEQTALIDEWQVVPETPRK
jgi:hypothetical protein